MQATQPGASRSPSVAAYTRPVPVPAAPGQKAPPSRTAWCGADGEATPAVRQRATGQGDDDVPAVDLFRRAIRDQDEGAWQALVHGYARLVRTWVHRHPCWPAVCDQWSDDHWVMASFERFWQAMPPERLVSFPTVASLLRYLKLCLHSALVDELRAQRARPPRPLPPRRQPALRQERSVDALALDRLLERELWQAVAEALTPEEWLVIRLTFLAELQPREIALGHPERFRTALDVYRVKRRALGRLRRGSVPLVGRGGAPRPALSGGRDSGGGSGKSSTGGPR
jgi:hypothetical protein